MFLTSLLRTWLADSNVLERKMASIAGYLYSDIYYLLFPDDLQIYAHWTLDDTLTTLQKLNKNAAKVARQASDNKLLLNGSKTQAIVSGSRAFITWLAPEDGSPLSIEGSLIAHQTSVKSLGGILGSTLQYRLHRFRKNTSISLTKHVIKAHSVCWLLLTRVLWSLRRKL